MTSLTLVTLLVVAYGVVSRQGYGTALALGGATAAGATVVVGGTAVPTFYAVALGVPVALVLRLLGRHRSASPARETAAPAVSLLLLFLLWSTVVTLVAPELFDGMIVLTPGADSGVLTAGFLTSSNVAQMIYLVLGVCIVAFLARSPSTRPELIGLAAGATTVLSLWRYLNQLVGLPFPEGLFDNSPTFNYIETAPNDVQRFRGILSEPAGLAVSSLVTISYMLPRALQLRGVRRWGAIFVAAAAFYLGSISTSASFVVAGVAVVLIAGLAFTLGFLMRRTSVSALVSIGTCAAVIAALWVLPVVTTFVQAVVDEKVSSSSYDDRSSSDSDSYLIFLDTFGMGVGLGTSRASSFLPSLLSTTGLVGALLFAVAVATLVHGSAGLTRYRPVVWALVSLLVVKVVSGPDLSDSSGILWLSLGVLSHAVLEHRTGRDARPPEPPPQSGAERGATAAPAAGPVL